MDISDYQYPTSSDKHFTSSLVVEPSTSMNASSDRATLLQSSLSTSASDMEVSNASFYSSATSINTPLNYVRDKEKHRATPLSPQSNNFGSKTVFFSSPIPSTSSHSDTKGRTVDFQPSKPSDSITLSPIYNSEGPSTDLQIPGTSKSVNNSYTFMLGGADPEDRNMGAGALSLFDSPTTRKLHRLCDRFRRMPSV